ncbi:MAG: hypothetical protein ACKOQM_01880 [Novosphingobium sp.]
MKPSAMWCFLALVLACAGGVVFWEGGREDFASANRQREILATYIPGAKCDAAQFDLLEQEEALQDWRYVFRIHGSPACIASIRSTLTSQGAKPLPPENAEQGIALPGHTDHETELVTFNFTAEPGAVIWTRDKT